MSPGVESLSVSSGGRSVTLAWTTSADFEHLTFTDSCITSGSLELKRIWIGIGGSW